MFWVCQLDFGRELLLIFEFVGNQQVVQLSDI
jgi:hypothetical protein